MDIQTDVVAKQRLDSGTSKNMGIVIVESPNVIYWTKDKKTRWIYTPPTAEGDQGMPEAGSSSQVCNLLYCNIILNVIS